MEIDEGVAYSVLVLGTTLDQLTTRIGLTYPHIYEGNPIARWLLVNNLWLLLDLSILILIIFPLSLILHARLHAKNRLFVLFTPMFIGICRVFTATWNVLLLLW